MIDTKVTRINNRWHCRVFLDGKLYDEMACECRMDVGYCFRTMLRWVDKMGVGDKHTDAVRTRMWDKEKYPNGVVGRVWPMHQLQSQKEKATKC